MKKIMAFLFCPMVWAQVVIRYIPEPMSVPAAVVANAKSLGRWQVDLCNEGITTVALPIQKVMMASGEIPFIDQADAMLVLTASARKSLAAKIVAALRYAGLGVSIGLAVASRSNTAWVTGLSVGSAVLPDVVNMVKGDIPSITPLASTVQWPMVLQPGVCATDHFFAAKIRHPKPITVRIKPSN